MTELVARSLARAGAWTGAVDRVTLDYAGRFLRRRRIATEAGRALLVDLPETVSLADGDALLTAEGPVAVRAAAEPLIEARAPDLARLAWHVGNRHTPAQIEPDRLLVARDRVMADLLARLGATLREVIEPFAPEGGAYGHGRTHGHGHGPATADPHAHAHDV